VTGPTFCASSLEISDGSCIAFFEIEDLPRGVCTLRTAALGPLALSVDSSTELEAARRHRCRTHRSHRAEGGKVGGWLAERTRAEV
jgi:hypothetical protein